MKKFLLIAIACFCLGSVATVRAEGGKHEEETELGERMERMRSAFKKLRKEAADPAKAEESLKLIADLKKAAEEAVGLTPALAAEVPEAKRAAFVEHFKKEMAEFVDVVAKLEAAVKAADFATAGKLVEELGARSKEGHKEFKKPDEKH